MKLDFDIQSLPTPCYVVDERRLKENLSVLHEVEQRTGCHILLAQKAYSMYETYPLIGSFLSGTTASSLFEARLGKEEMGKEVHIFAPAYREDEIDEILELVDHIVFNSIEQLQRFSNNIKKAKEHKALEVGLRINPEYSEIEVDMYNPCFPNSRFGITSEQMEAVDVSLLDGLHFHTMCEQNSDVLKRTLQHVEEKFGSYLSSMKWINFGGGHHITKSSYDRETLVECIEHIQKKYQVEVYLEPGEAIALNAGYLVSEVLEVMERDLNLAILDTSASCHMPDVLEMPYRPEMIGAKNPETDHCEGGYCYRLGGPTCLSGDVIGDYVFEEPLQVHDRLVFCDMAIYSMVKNNTFNGINLPSIAIYREKTGLQVLKQFGYKNFKCRL